MSLLKMDNVSKNFGNLSVIKNVSISFPSKGLIAIKGKSGSGKSTILNLISGLLYPDSGKIFFQGKDISKFSRKKMSKFHCKGITNIFQHYNLIENLSAKKNIEIAAKIGKTKGLRFKKKLNTLSKICGVKHILHKNVSNCSGGEKQRIAIVRSLINNPKVILADEPTGALDYINSDTIMNLLKDFSSTILVIIVSHNDELIEKYADYCVELKHGKFQYTLETINCQKERTFKSKYCSSWTKNLFSLHLREEFKINFLLFISVVICFLSLTISFGFYNGSKNSTNSIRYKSLQFTLSSVSEKNYIEVEGSPLKLVRNSRPSIETCKDAFNNLSSISVNPDLSYFVPSYSVFELNGDIKDPCEFSPIYDISLSEFGLDLLIPNVSNNLNITNGVFVNEEFANLYKAKVGDYINIDYDASFNNDTIHLTYGYVISGIVKEFSFLNNPRVYYSYIYAQNYLLNYKLKDTNLYELISNAESDSEIGCYRYLVFLHKIKYADEYFQMIEDNQKNENLISISSNVYDIVKSFIDLTDSFISTLIIFVIIALIGTALIIGLLGYSKLIKRKKEVAVLLVLGGRANDVEDIFAFEAMAISATGALCSLILSIYIEGLLNSLLKGRFNLDNLIDISYSNFLAIPFLIPVTIVFIALFLSFIGTYIPLKIIKNFPLAEVLRDE